MRLRQPNERRGEVHQREVVTARLLVARRNTAAALDVVEEALHTVANPVEPLVTTVFLCVGRVRRDHRLHAADFHGRTDLLRVVSSVTDEGATLRMFQKRFSDGGLVSLTGCQFEVERPSFRVDDRVDLGGESTT